MTAAVVRLLAEETGKGRELPVPPWAVGVGVFTLLVLLLLVTLSFGKDR
ncbi:MAG TPA: hypothetical protein VF314_00995 [Actinomycetes bacterium]